MTQTLEALAHHMASLESIHSVVHTMKTLSVINSAPYEQAARNVEEYHRTVLDGLHAFLTALGRLEPPRQEVDERLLVVFGSDHGLCGSYNDTLGAHVRDHIVADTERTTTILCVGARMADALADRELGARKVFFPPASVDGIGRLANLLTQNLDDARRDAFPHEIAVDLAYLARDDAQAQAPQFLRLLPLNAAFIEELQTTPWHSRSLPCFSMSSEELFSSLIRGHIFASLFRAAAEAMVTENAARLALMQQAERSVEDRLADLTSEANRVRQSEITTELLDVTIGFEALKKSR